MILLYTLPLFLLRTVHKRRPQSGGCLCSADKGGFFRYGRPHFFVQKASGFS